MTALPSGTGLRLKDRYVIEKELGRGGIGVVYLARDEQLHSRPVVIKVLLDQTSDSEWFQRKFKGEIEALVRIDHPGVVGALDAGEMPDGKPFLVMQYVPGANLRSMMNGGLLEVPVIADIVRQVGSALSAAHEAGVHHRDLKPENIMVKDLGHGERQVKIIDFGIATVRDPADAGTQMTQVAGSVLYMAPEQLMGKPSASSDIYALAVIAYELITGRPPFRPHSPYELLGIQRSGVREKPSELRPGLSPVVDAVVIKGLSLEPHDRQLTARQLADELYAALTAAAAHAVTARNTQGTEALGDAPPQRPTLVPAETVRSRGYEPTANLEAPPRPEPARGPVTPPPGPGHPLPQAPPRPPERSKMPLVLGIGAAVVIAVTAGVVMVGRRPPQPSPSASPTTVAPAAGPELSYYLTVQKYQDGKPYRDPMRLSREMLFGPQDRLRLTVTGAEPGYLYIVNEGPGPGGGITYNVLRPRTTEDGGSASLPAGREVHIPAADRYFAFDEAQGTENFWLIFARTEVPELEAVKGAANPEDRGVVKDPTGLQGLRSFLEQHRAAAAKATTDETARTTVLRAGGSVLVSLLKLEHM
jgi:serine/threonine protein kinase